MGAIERILVSGLNEKGKEKKESKCFYFSVYYLPFDSPYLVDKEEESFCLH